MSEQYRFDKDGKSLSLEGAVDTLLTQQQQQQSILRDQGLISRMKRMEVDNQEMRAAIQKMQIKLDKLEEILVGAKPAVAQTILRQVEKNDDEEEDEEDEDDEDDEDDEIDLFGEDAADAKKPEAAERKLVSKKPEIVAKSTILLDVKPWDDETDMVEVERCVRSVAADGLLWGASRLVEVGYGIKKLQINCVVEDDKVGTDMLEEEITKFKDLVQSVDVASFNKI